MQLLSLHAKKVQQRTQYGVSLERNSVTLVFCGFYDPKGPNIVTKLSQSMVMFYGHLTALVPRYILICQFTLLFTISSKGTYIILE